MHPSHTIPQVPFFRRRRLLVGHPTTLPAEPPEVLVMPVTYRAGRRLWEITVVIMSTERVDLWFLIPLDKRVGFFLAFFGLPGNVSTMCAPGFPFLGSCVRNTDEISRHHGLARSWALFTGSHRLSQAPFPSLRSPVSELNLRRSKRGPGCELRNKMGASWLFRASGLAVITSPEGGAHPYFHIR